MNDVQPNHVRQWHRGRRLAVQLFVRRALLRAAAALRDRPLETSCRTRRELRCTRHLPGCSAYGVHCVVLRHARSRSGFTLVEVLLATAITLIMMAAVVTLFGFVGGRVADSRALLEMSERLRATRLRLQEDLAGVTAPMVPPLRPEENKGYFEYVEGVVVEPFQNANVQTVLVSAPQVAVNTVRGTPVPDNSAGDFDDILMFTTRSQGEPFVGRFALPPPSSGQQPTLITVRSQVAEVAWFVRHNTLYRRVLLVNPTLEIPPQALQNAGYYALYDISARQEGGAYDRTPGGPYPVRIVPNSLGDLTKRENRYGHQPYVYPHDVRFWGRLGLPTLAECSAINPAATPMGLWPFPLIEAPAGSSASWSFPGAAYPVQAHAYPDAMSQLIVPGGLGVVNDPTYIPPIPPSGNPPHDTPRQVLDLTSTINNTGTPWAKPLDLWVDQPPWQEFIDPGVTPATPTRWLQTNQRYGFFATRVAEDVILTNVLSFDVKAYDPEAVVLTDSQGQGVYHPGDPGYLEVFRQWIGLAPADRPAQVVSLGAYVDLNYLNDLAGVVPGSASFSHFSGPGNPRSGLSMVYDTWSDHYERDGFDQNQNGLTDEGTDGLDNDGLTGIDDANEREAPPPYEVPLRGIQVKIRVYEPSTRQIREVTVVQKFLPE